MIAIQILLDGFAISALYALGATGFTLIFGVSGVLNLSHGALMVLAAVIAWAATSSLGVGSLGGASLGVVACVVTTMVTYFCVVRPLQRSKKVASEEREIFVLTGSLLSGILISL